MEKLNNPSKRPSNLQKAIDFVSNNVDQFRSLISQLRNSITQNLPRVSMRRLTKPALALLIMGALACCNKDDIEPDTPKDLVGNTTEFWKTNKSNFSGKTPLVSNHSHTDSLVVKGMFKGKYGNTYNVPVYFNATNIAQWYQRVHGTSLASEEKSVAMTNLNNMFKDLKGKIVAIDPAIEYNGDNQATGRKKGQNQYYLQDGDDIIINPHQ